jgi:DNA/RNA-binding domain of Phe-tRNA-synthetase-like protein
MRAEARAARDAAAEQEDPTLAAYNDHLAELSTKPKKRLWGH